jgi:DNA-binding MarR family transcriptional regulator
MLGMSLPIHPSTVSKECLCLALKRSARAVARRYDQAFQSLGLNSGQFSMLTVVAGLEPVGILPLAEKLAMDRSTVTAALKPLQGSGWVRVEVSPTDKRGRDVVLTREGRAILARAMPRWRAVQEELAAELSTDISPAELLEQLQLLA